MPVSVRADRPRRLYEERDRHPDIRSCALHDQFGNFGVTAAIFAVLGTGDAAFADEVDVSANLCAGHGRGSRNHKGTVIGRWRRKQGVRAGQGHTEGRQARQQGDN